MKRFVRVVMPLLIAVGVMMPAGVARAAATNYVALGDSYSSGVGTDHYDLSSTCDRSSLAYPALVAAAKGYALTFQACSGATTTDVINNQVSAITTSTNVVTVTAGGNDVGFANLLILCTVTDCQSTIYNSIIWAITQLPARLDAMYAQIHTHAPAAKVIVLGYPHLFSGTCLGALGFSSSEVTAANYLADAVDALTQAEATRFGFTYKSSIAQFTNHGVCASKAWLHGLDLTAITSSYHPTTTGQSSGFEPLVLAAL